MNRIVWLDDFVLGIDMIDGHHKQLVALINLVAECLGNNAAPSQLASVLGGLKDYATYHFNAEEEFMKKIGYPDCAAHGRLHHKFSDHITGLGIRFEEGDSTVLEELAAYLEFWLIDHIVVNDSLYASFAGSLDERHVMV